MDIGDIVQARFYCSKGDQASVTVRHWLTATKIGSGGTLQDLADKLSTAMAPLFKALINSGATYVGCDTQILFPTLGVPAQSVIGAGVGLTAGDPLPAQTAGLISFRTSLGGRKNRGRCYVPFPTEVDNDASGDPNAAYLVELFNLGAGLVASYNPAGGAGNTNRMDACIYHKSTHTTTAITSYLRRDRWATQRRRGGFGRPNSTPF